MYDSWKPEKTGSITFIHSTEDEVEPVLNSRVLLHVRPPAYHRRKSDRSNADKLAILKFIEAHPGVQVSEIMTFTGKSRPTVNRYVARLVEISKIEIRGSRKTGGYYIL